MNSIASLGKTAERGKGKTLVAISIVENIVRIYFFQVFFYIVDIVVFLRNLGSLGRIGL